MACIISLAANNALGVVTMTNPEFEKAKSDLKLMSALHRIRDRYLIGIHHNWHPVRVPLEETVDFHLLPNDQFDGPDPSGTRLINLDACNFTPSEFYPSKEPPAWDVLVVGRSVKFKRPGTALDTIKQLTRIRPTVRVLFISPMPPRTPMSWRSVDHGLPRRYERLFSVAERDNVTVLSLRENYPFPFSRRELAVFYRASRVFVHFAPAETRCRVAAYAWASGIPVVGTRGIGDLLPAELLVEPAFYEVENDEFVSAIVAALDRHGEFDSTPYRQIVSSEASVQRFVNSINELPRSDGQMAIERILSSNLDIRLGWHHGGASDVNGPGHSLLSLLVALDDLGSQADAALSVCPYPEREIGASNVGW